MWVFLWKFISNVLLKKRSRNQPTQKKKPEPEPAHQKKKPEPEPAHQNKKPEPEPAHKKNSASAPQPGPKVRTKYLNLLI